MNRRPAPAIVGTLLGLLLVIGLVFAPADVAGATVPPPVDDGPVVTVNPFIPEDVDLTTCVGTLPRPGCGSEERGGIRQTLVALAMIGGLAVIFGRIAWGIRRNQRRTPTP